MKKLVSLILAVLMAVMCMATAFAANPVTESVLRVHDDHTFTIVNLCDVQDIYPMNTTTHQFIEEMLAEVKPDVVVLGGDNCVADGKDKPAAIKEICDLFVNAETNFTLVFGNHDHQQGVDNETQLRLYQEYGGKYCLAYDAVPSLTGVGTHNLPIMSADGREIVFNLYMFDSNSYSFNEAGEEMGYDAVHEDEIDWYLETAEALKNANGGKAVPSFAFQHIVVQEAYDKLFYESPRTLGKLTNDFDGHSYIYLPKVGDIKSGYLLEPPCPGYYNYGQLSAMAQNGDVLAVFSGHDHVNSYTVNIAGVNVTNTPGCTYHSYGNDLNRGCRIIRLTAGDEVSYETEVYSIAAAALKEGSKIPELGKMNKVKAWFTVLADKGLTLLMRFVTRIFFFAK